MNEGPSPDRKDQTQASGTALDGLVERVGAKRLLLGLLLACLLIVPPIVWFSTKGSNGKPASSGPTAAQAAAAGCELHEFEFGVTNDPESGRAYQQEALFGSHPPLPRDGFQAGKESPSLPYILHSLAHEWLVVKYNPSLDAAGIERLERFAEQPDLKGVAVVPGGTDQSAGIAAIRWGHGLNCADAGPRAIAVLNKFEQGVEASLPGDAPIR